MNSSDKNQQHITPARRDHSPGGEESRLAPDMLGNGRYKVGAMMGRGGFGAVYEGHDQLTGQRVAIKLMGESYGKQMAYAWREAALLRLLQLPGVVQLIEEGREQDCTYLVMELVEGTPFPGEGARGDWSKIEGPMRQLLAALERVHLEGIVHRDLKPHNVLVRADGSVVLLDFGLSMDPNLFAHLTTIPSSITGTPAYLAPEQWRSEPASRQTDLWAVGIMLYEALCGKLPFSSSHMLDVMREILAGKLTLESLPRDVPGHVVWLLHSLLATSPQERPASAGDALASLDGGPLQRRHQLPLIGRDEPRARIVELLLDGQSVRLVGKNGCGRSRMLQEVREVLGRKGRFTLRLWPADQPLHSLRELLPPGAIDESSEQLAHAQLADALAAHMILLAEDLDTLDPLTRALISARLPDHPVLLGEAGRGVTHHYVELAPLSEHQLIALFGGHERVFRMRSGGAHELWRRTGGNASLIAREIEGWVQAQMARWHSDKLVLEPDALARLRAGLQVIEPQRERPEDTIEERIQAWLYLTQPEADPAFISNLVDISASEVSAHMDLLATRGDIRRDEDGAVFVHKAAWMEQALPAAMRMDAHRSIATALPQGHPRRLYHLLAAGEQASVVDEQLAQALRWDAQGMVQRALLALDDSIKAARTQRPRQDETPLLLAASRIALASGSKRDLERLLYSLDATPHPAHIIQTCTSLVSIALQIIQGASLKGLEALEELIVIFDDDELELRRCQWRWRACQALPMEVAERKLEDIGQWAESTQDENIKGTYLGWLGTLRYRQQRFEEAARLHIRAASLKQRPTARISSWLNAIVAFESALLLDEAWHACEQARRQAIQCEHRDYELYASAFARQLAYRRDEPLEPDPELLEVMRVSGALANMTSIIVVETMILWRAGDREGARRLAGEGLNVYTNLGLRSVTIVACLIAALDEGATITERLWEEVRQLEMPRLLVQCAGILATRQMPPDNILEMVRQRADAVPPLHWHTRLEMISFAQAFEQLGLAPPDHITHRATPRDT